MEELKTINVVVYPNPTTNSLNIDSDEKIKEVLIFDISGNLIHIETTSEFSVEHLTNGVYLLSIQTALGVIFKRFTKE
jgi:hypothetical protein